MHLIRRMAISLGLLSAIILTTVYCLKEDQKARPQNQTQAQTQPQTTTSPTDLGGLSLWTEFCSATDATNQYSSAVAANNEFLFSLYGQVRSQAGNLFLSPFSISTALSMTYAGAKNNTATQMVSALHFAKDADQHAQMRNLLISLQCAKNVVYSMDIANRLWGQVDYKFKSDFLSLTKKDYVAPLYALDFKTQAENSRVTINNWIAEMTHDKIKDLIAQGLIVDSTKLVLTNAVYFKAPWVTEFYPAANITDQFWKTDTESTAATFMTLQTHLNYFEDANVKAIDLPFRKDSATMSSRHVFTVILPKSRTGLAAVEASLTAANVASWRSQMTSAETRLSLPKFKFESKFELSEKLKALGITDAFSGDVADFSGMYEPGQTPLMISKVIHQANIDVNEKGAEAAAATAVIMTEGAMAPSSDIKEFKADHPFFFMISDGDTKTILFAGRLSEYAH